MGLAQEERARLWMAAVKVLAKFSCLQMEPLRNSALVILQR